MPRGEKKPQIQIPFHINYFFSIAREKENILFKLALNLRFFSKKKKIINKIYCILAFELFQG